MKKVRWPLENSPWIRREYGCVDVVRSVTFIVKIVNTKWYAAVACFIPECNFIPYSRVELTKKFTPGIGASST